MSILSTKKQSETEFLADLKARQVYAQSVYQSHSNDIIPQNAEFVNTWRNGYQDFGYSGNQYYGRRNLEKLKELTI